VGLKSDEPDGNRRSSTTTQRCEHGDIQLNSRGRGLGGGGGWGGGSGRLFLTWTSYEGKRSKGFDPYQASPGLMGKALRDRPAGTISKASKRVKNKMGPEWFKVRGTIVFITRGRETKKRRGTLKNSSLHFYRRSKFVGKGGAVWGKNPAERNLYIQRL